VSKSWANFHFWVNYFISPSGFLYPDEISELDGINILPTRFFIIFLMEYFISTAIFSAMVSKLGQVIYKDKIEFVHEDSKKKSEAIY